MPDFEIVSPDREDLVLMPALSSTPPPFTLANSEKLLVGCSFGEMQFYHYQGEGYSIWQSIYRIDRPVKLIGRCNRPVLELTSMYDQHFAIDWRDVFTGQLPAKQMELYHAPYVDNTATFAGAKEYMTLDVHLESSMLEPYAADFPLLADFLDQVHRGAPAKLFPTPQLASPRMNATLTDILRYNFLDRLASRYYESQVHLLLIQLLERVSGFPAAARVLPRHGLELAEEAKRLLTLDYEASLTIAQLCRKLGTNPYTLKTAFRQVFGLSIGKYKKAAFMDYAKQLLLDTNQSLDDISILLGYNSQQSFNTAFRNHFGYTPGRVRRKS